MPVIFCPIIPSPWPRSGTVFERLCPVSCPSEACLGRLDPFWPKGAPRGPKGKTIHAGPMATPRTILEGPLSRPEGQNVPAASSIGF